MGLFRNINNKEDKAHNHRNEIAAMLRRLIKAQTIATKLSNDSSFKERMTPLIFIKAEPTVDSDDQDEIKIKLFFKLSDDTLYNISVMPEDFQSIDNFINFNKDWIMLKIKGIEDFIQGRKQKRTELEDYFKSIYKKENKNG